MHGLKICPDLDTITYTLGRAEQRQRPAGACTARPGGSWTSSTRSAVSRGSAWATATWPRTSTAPHRLAEGAASPTVTAELREPPRRRRPAAARDRRPVGDRSSRPPSRRAGSSFQEYFVRHRHDVAVSSSISIEGADGGPAGSRRPRGHRRRRSAIVICPSNPLISIAPLLAVPGRARGPRPTPRTASSPSRP